LPNFILLPQWRRTVVALLIKRLPGKEKQRARYQEFSLCEDNQPIKSRDSSVGIVLGYGLDDRGSRVRFPAGAGNFSLHHRVQNDSGAHPASYAMGTRNSFPGSKAARA
jgi:hypothetical protein